MPALKPKHSRRYSRLKRDVSKQYRRFVTWVKHWRVAREIWVVWEEDQSRLRGVWETLVHRREELEVAVETAALFHSDRPPGVAEEARVHLLRARAFYADQARVMKALLTELRKARILHKFHSERAHNLYVTLRDELKMQINGNLTPHRHYVSNMDPFGTDDSQSIDECPICKRVGSVERSDSSNNVNEARH